MEQVAPLRYEVIFKKAFGRLNLFTGLVKNFLGIQLEIDKGEHDKIFEPLMGNVAKQLNLTYLLKIKKPSYC